MEGVRSPFPREHFISYKGFIAGMRREYVSQLQTFANAFITRPSLTEEWLYFLNEFIHLVSSTMY